MWWLKVCSLFCRRKNKRSDCWGLEELGELNRSEEDYCCNSRWQGPGLIAFLAVPLRAALARMDDISAQFMLPR